MKSSLSRTVVLAATLALAPLAPAQADTWHGLSNILGLGLPTVAAGLSIWNDDAAGLTQLLKAEATTLVTTEVLKRAVHEERPNGRDNKSFPSGHTAIAFSAAQYMQQRGGWEYGVPAYALAAVVGYSRVKGREHYERDVLAGALLGAASSWYFNDPNERSSFAVWFGPDRSAQAQYRTSW